MKRSTKHGLPALLICAAAALVPTQSVAEDIDIFTGGGAGSSANPKILIVLDNTSNWSRQNQNWPGGLTQGQSEARAINTVLGSIGSDVNLGLMEFVTGSPATATGGFIRYAIAPMTDANKSAFSTQLSTIFNNINEPDEKKNAGTEYGNLMYDAYNYFNGGNSFSPGAVIASKADSNGYTTNYTTFRSPLSDANACGRNFVIFIGNPNASGPTADTAANGATLTTLGGSVSPQLLVPELTPTTTTNVDNLGYDSQCVASQSACTTADYATQCAAGGLYTSCACSSTSTTERTACPVGTQRYSVTAHTITASGSTTLPDVVTHPTFTGTSACYINAAAAAGDHGGMSLPGQSVVVTGTAPDITTTTTTYSNDTYTIGGVNAAASASCTPIVTDPSLGSSQTTHNTANSTSCYTKVGNGAGQWNASATTDFGGLTSAPLTSTSSSTDPVTGVTTTVNYSYSYSYSGTLGSECSPSTSPKTYRVIVDQAVTATPSTVTSTPRYKFDVIQSVAATASAVVQTGAIDTPTPLGDTAQCYADTSNVTETAGACAAYNGGCSFGAASASAGFCPSGGARYLVTGSWISIADTATGRFIAPDKAANADEWARFMHQERAMNPATTPASTIKQSITTYTIDVFNAQQNDEESALYMNMARLGGGKYFAAKNEAAIVAALKKILIEIQSVNTTFASASLPVNATNRTQNANQVFIGMFRPDPDASPRWFGNLKQYQIGTVNGDLDLVDKHGRAATNVLTGFIDDCAASFWTTDSSSYWSVITVNPDPASKCDPSVITASPLSSTGVYSDLPDGPTVEKGAVGEILRMGNLGSTAGETTANRTVLTLSGGSLVSFTDATVITGAADDAAVAKFTMGVDINNDTGRYDPSTNATQTRPSLHGDVVHSRPLPVNYGGTAGVTVYYGANDGMLRAVDASNGKERWAFVAPEQYASLKRLKDNSPGVNYSTDETAGFPRKDYFFDGSIGIYQAAAVGTNPPVWIYPTQRRGGRMIYSFDVSNPSANPGLKWRKGCTSSSGGCDTGFAQMGQTWSTPNVAFVNGYSTKTTNPVVVVGGGYDTCEDANSKLVTGTNCTATKGNVIYIIDAGSGALITSYETARAVAADVNLIDLDNDGLVDYAYAADTGGNIWRIDFVESPSTTKGLAVPGAINNTGAAADPSKWFMHKVAFTNNAAEGRKFLFGPGLFPTGSSTFLAIVSGDREHPLRTDYPFAGVTNRAYIYKDDLTSTAATAAVNLDDETKLFNQTELSEATCTSRNLITSPDMKGWFMDLNQYGTKDVNDRTGEQGVTSAVIVGGMVTFSTNRPLSSNLSCSNRLGEARGYFVNLFNGSGAIGTANNAPCGGSRSSSFAGGGLPPSPVIGIVPIDGVPTAVLIGAVQRDESTSSPIKPTKITPPISQSRTRTYKYIKGDN